MNQIKEHDPWSAKRKNKFMKEDIGIAENELDEVVKTLDMAIIQAGAPGHDRKSWVQKLFQLLQDLCEPSYDPNLRPLKRRKTDQSLGKLNDDNDTFNNVPFFTPPLAKCTYPFPFVSD